MHNDVSWIRSFSSLRGEARAWDFGESHQVRPHVQVDLLSWGNVVILDSRRCGFYFVVHLLEHKLVVRASQRFGSTASCWKWWIGWTCRWTEMPKQEEGGQEAVLCWWVWDRCFAANVHLVENLSAHAPDICHVCT